MKTETKDCGCENPAFAYYCAICECDRPIATGPGREVGDEWYCDDCAATEPEARK